MLSIRNFRVRSLDLDYLQLFWEIVPTNEDPYDYTFTVQRSGSPEGPWDQISQPFSDKYTFRDVTINPFDRWRVYNYRILVTNKNTSEETYSEVCCLSAKPDLIALEVRRLETILFSEFVGRRCWLFPRRSFGQRCPECYDRVSGQRVKSQCITCYDTSFVLGYFDPIECYIQIDPTAKASQNLEVIATQQQNASGRLIDYPPVSISDMIVERENIRWRVVSVSETQRLRSVLHQELVLHEIPRSDIEYKIPINITDLASMEPSPPRNFTNPHNLDSMDSEYWSAVRTFYGFRGV